MSSAGYQREWRAKHGAKTGEPGRPATEPCGTVAAYKRHKRRGEPVDAACREAYNAEQRRLYAERNTEARDMTFKVGDLVLLPDDRVATVVYLGEPDGSVTVETPWSAQWRRFSPGSLRLVADEVNGDET